MEGEAWEQVEPPPTLKLKLIKISFDSNDYEQNLENINKMGNSK